MKGLTAMPVKRFSIYMGGFNSGGIRRSSKKGAGLRYTNGSN